MISCRLVSCQTGKSCVLHAPDNTLIATHRTDHQNIRAGSLARIKKAERDDTLAPMFVWHNDEWCSIMRLDAWTVAGGWDTVWTRE